MKLLVTGSSGLIGSEVVVYFAGRGHSVIGVDNNMRKAFFGPAGDTSWNLDRLLREVNAFKHYDLDIRSRQQVLDLIKRIRPDAVIHCAAQPSHDLARDCPFDDFDVNAVGTVNLLEASRLYAAESPFVFMSTNKVYGDAPNEKELVEQNTRWEYSDPRDYFGIDESCRIDQCTHSLFGTSKAAADLITQEYGRYFGMPTVCFRGGCLTGPRHSGVELHGFVSYLTKVVVAGSTYTIFGYKGKQVRDQIHSSDVARAVEEFIKSPRRGEVYNLGGGRQNSISVLECLDKVGQIVGCEAKFEYSDQPRAGDHICYISDVRKLKRHYPEWDVTRPLDRILEEIVESELDQHL